MKPILALTLIWVLLSFSAVYAEDSTVKITKRAPVQTLGSDGVPTGVTMSTPGTSMTFVRMNGDQVVLKGADGVLYMISLAATDYTPPSAAPTPAPAVAVSPSATPPTADKTAPPTNPNPVPPPAVDETAQKLSAAFGMPIFTDDHFWSDPITDVAKRLEYEGPNSKTGNEVFYGYGKAMKRQFTVFNCPCYGMGMEGKAGTPTYITFLFLNMVQSPDAQNRLQPSDDEVKQVNETVKGKMAADEQTISDALSAILGQPAERDAGLGGENRREVRRWNWKDVAFLLSYREDAYIFMEIMPVKEADRIESGTAPARPGDDEFVKRVVDGPHGDVTLSEIPETCELPEVGGTEMGQWQRYLHYMEVPGDSYIFGVMEGHSFTKQDGTNWNVRMARPVLNDYLSAYHCHAEAIKDVITFDLIANSIDKGIPLLWCGFLFGEDEINAHAHAAAREGQFDVDAYKAQLEKEDLDRARVKTTPSPADLDFGSLLVVGYNKDTQEVALKGLSSGGESPLMWITIRTMKRIAPYGLRRLSWEHDHE